MTDRKTPADIPVPPTTDPRIDAPTKGRVDGGSASDVEAVNFDDDEIYGGRGNNARRGGTDKAQGADSGRLGPPSEQLSRRNGPSDRS